MVVKRKKGRSQNTSTDKLDSYKNSLLMNFIPLRKAAILLYMIIRIVKCGKKHYSVDGSEFRYLLVKSVRLPAMHGTNT